MFCCKLVFPFPFCVERNSLQHGGLIMMSGWFQLLLKYNWILYASVELCAGYMIFGSGLQYFGRLFPCTVLVTPPHSPSPLHSWNPNPLHLSGHSLLPMELRCSKRFHWGKSHLSFPIFYNFRISRSLVLEVKDFWGSWLESGLESLREGFHEHSWYQLAWFALL